MKGVLLVNLGSPDTPEPADVKNYLREFLMDERVIDFPYIVRSLLVKGIILNTRPKKSAKAYKKIWWKEGSPLIVLSKRLKEKLKSNNIEGSAYILDITDEHSIEHLYSDINKDFSATPDVVVNNAGITNDNLLIRMSDEQWFKTINTNLNSLYTHLLYIF